LTDRQERTMALPNRRLQPAETDRAEPAVPDGEPNGRGAGQTGADERSAGAESWGERFERLHEQVRCRIPDTIPPEEIEADITAASEEVRRRRRAPRRR
jgi:hypothetical protein